MKVSTEHLDMMRGAITPFDTDDRRASYRSGDFPRADKVEDLDMRYRWDLFYAASRRQQTYPLSHPLTTVLCDAGYNDSHIDTALRSIVAPLAREEIIR